MTVRTMLSSRRFARIVSLNSRTDLLGLRYCSYTCFTNEETEVWEI